MDKDERDRRVRELGLEKLARDHTADLDKALANAANLAGRIPTDLHWTDEPAHTYSLAPRRNGRKAHHE